MTVDQWRPGGSGERRGLPRRRCGRHRPHRGRREPALTERARPEVDREGVLDDLGAVGLNGVVSYDLRHSFASLLVHEGASSIVDIASYLGHAPSQTLDTYSHVVEELRGAEKVPADQQILRARRQIRPISGPRAAGEAGRVSAEAP